MFKKPLFKSHAKIEFEPFKNHANFENIIFHANIITSQNNFHANIFKTIEREAKART
jgi:hypothetical protein